MPRLIISVSEEQRELWVRCAHAELVSLSEWLRRAAEVRAVNGLGAEPVRAGAVLSSGEVSVGSVPESAPAQPSRNRKKRSEMCEHRRQPDEFCPRCDNGEAP